MQPVFCRYSNGKFHPGTGHEGPKVELMYISTYSLTSVPCGSGSPGPLSLH